MSFSLIVSLFLVVLPLNVTTNTTGSGLKQNLQSEHQKQCDQELSLAQLLDEITSITSGGVPNSWIEYVAMENGIKNDLSFRLSFLKNSNSGTVGLEVWFDNLGSRAVHVEKDSDGAIVQDIKIGSVIYRVPKTVTPKTDVQRNTPADCSLSNRIKNILRESIEKNEKLTIIETLAGKFDCASLSIKLGSTNMQLFVSEKAPFPNIVSINFGENRRIDLVASGSNAYSSFPVGSEPVLLEKMADMIGFLTNDVQAGQKIKGGGQESPKK